MAIMTNGISTYSARKIGVMRLAVTGSFAAVVFFILCWIGAVITTGPASHMYVQLFTYTDVSSAAALFQGIIWSIAFGLFGGALIAVSYNMLAFLDRR